MKTINLKLTDEQVELLSKEMGGISLGIKKILVYVQGQNKHIRNAIKLVGEAVLPENENVNAKPFSNNIIKHDVTSFINHITRNEIRLKLKRSEYYQLYLDFCSLNKIKKMGKKTFFEEMRSHNLCEEKRTNNGVWFFILLNSKAEESL